MYPNLKLHLWKCGIRQNRLAQLVGIHETLLSKIVNGFRMPDSELRARIATALDCDETWLFAGTEARELPKPTGRRLDETAPQRGADGLQAKPL